MELDIIIGLLKKYTFTNKDIDGELGEQDAPAASTGGGGGTAYPTVQNGKQDFKGVTQIQLMIK